MNFIRNALFGALVTATVVVGVAAPAVAIPQLAAASVVDPSPIFVFDGIPVPILIGLVTGAVIPAVVGLIARVVAKVSSSTMSPLAKGVWLSALSVASGAVTSIGQALAAGDPINVGVWVVTTVSAFVVAVTTYFGLTSRLSSKGNSLALAIKGGAAVSADEAAASLVSKANGRHAKP